MLDGARIEIDLAEPGQLAIFKQEFGKQKSRSWYEPGTSRFLIEVLRSGDTFIDAGANWGYFTTLASRIVGNRGLVVAFEPVPRTFGSLLNTIRRNRLANVVYFNAAAGERSGETVTMHAPWYRDPAIAYVESFERGDVPTLALDRVWEQLDRSDRCLRAIKLDVEGAELMILKGAQQILKEASPYLIVESGVHSHRFGYCFDDLVTYLREMGYCPRFAVDNRGVGHVAAYQEDRDNRADGLIVFAKGP